MWDAFDSVVTNNKIGQLKGNYNDNYAILTFFSGYEICMFAKIKLRLWYEA